SIHKNRYQYLGMQRYSSDMYQGILGIDTNDENYLYFPLATRLKSQETPTKNNISFIGSAFFPWFDFNKDDPFYEARIFSLHDDLKDNFVQLNTTSNNQKVNKSGKSD